LTTTTTKKKDNEETRESTLVVELTAARWRHFAWAAAGLAIGAVMIARMGEIGLVLGGAVVLGGLLAARSFVMTLLHPPGVIAVREAEVVLPGQVCSGVQKTIPLDELRHAYLLRRALPWNHTGPVLVVETRRGVFQYPRDWFAGEPDQRRVFTALNRRLGRLA
jgi:hypothetical protein